MLENLENGNLAQRFLLDDLDIRGALVQLDSVWQALLSGRNYPLPVQQLLGEMCASTLLIACQLKQNGRLSIQLRGNGAVKLLLLDCNAQLHIRGMAQCAEPVLPGSAAQLLGDGQLVLNLETESMRQPYQSLVPLASGDGASIADIFEHYLAQSEQQASRLILACSPERVAGIFLQKMPGADQRDADGWARVNALLATLTNDELLHLSPPALLTRLFHEEAVRLFEAKKIEHHEQEDWQKVRAMLRLLGRDEVYSILQEQGEVLIEDEIDRRQYRFDAAAIDAIFNVPNVTQDPAQPSSPSTLH
ncbi:MAG: Hsp33 family molecular chaperone HslO [Pseudomonadota bacterium]